ncbi:MAG: hypothetical protein RL514_4596 [Verrucomicrobiota bacterium]|jgi:arylsulfatase A-like enzyme
MKRLILSLALHLYGASLLAAEKPNIIVILADDVGLGNLGAEKGTTNDAEKARLQAILAALNPAGQARATGSERPAENGGNRKQRQ